MSDKTIDDDTLRAMLAGMQHGPVHITADRCTGDSRAVEAFCDLVRVAPSLAAEVLRLRGEIERRDADHAEMECSEIERHQRMCAALDIPEEDRAYATDAEVEAAATDAVRERDALAAEVLRLRRIEAAVRADIAAEDAHNAANAAREAAWRHALAKDADEMSAEGQRRHKAVGRAIKAWQKTARAAIAARAELRSVVLGGGQ